MFIFRGVAISLAIFALFYSLLSALVSAAWRLPGSWHLAEGSRARLLFALRVSPMLASATLTLAFVVPSFQALEPRSVDERMGVMPLVMGVCALVLVGLGSLRIAITRRKTAHVVTNWLAGTPIREFGISPRILAFLPLRDVPPLMVIGVLRPSVFVSESAIAALNSGELEVSFKHEFSHLHSYDNLKKLLFRFCPFPGMERLESAWNEAAELAADKAAVTDQRSALDLASAMLKIARLMPPDSSPTARSLCVTGFVSGSVSMRVERLVSWTESEANSSQGMTAGLAFATAYMVAMLSLSIAKYGVLLADAHELTEWLVR